MTRGTQSDRPAEHVEKLLDKMAKDSFPASDPPQLEGFNRDGEASRRTPSKPYTTHAPPPDVGELPGSEQSPFDREGCYPIGGNAEVTLRTEGGAISIELGANPLTLDAAGLEELIALLERHRPSLHNDRPGANA